MKRKPKVLVVPHYNGSEKKSHVFKIVITEQIKKKLENAEKSAQKKIIHYNSKYYLKFRDNRCIISTSDISVVLAIRRLQ